MALQIGKITFSRLGQGIGQLAHGLSGHFGPFPPLDPVSWAEGAIGKAADQPPLGHFLHRRCKPLVLYIGKGCITLLGQEGQKQTHCQQKGRQSFHSVYSHLVIPPVSKLSLWYHKMPKKKTPRLSPGRWHVEKVA